MRRTCLRCGTMWRRSTRSTRARTTGFTTERERYAGYRHKVGHSRIAASGATRVATSARSGRQYACMDVAPPNSVVLPCRKYLVLVQPWTGNIVPKWSSGMRGERVPGFASSDQADFMVPEFQVNGGTPNEFEFC